MSEASQTEATNTTPAVAAAEPAPAPIAAIPGPDELLAAAKKEVAANYDRYMRGGLGEFSQAHDPGKG
jgi:hypothetical protein